MTKRFPLQSTSPLARSMSGFLALASSSAYTLDAEPFVLIALDGNVAAAPKNVDDARDLALCDGEARPAAGAADQALVGAGWMLFYEPKVSGSTRVVTAAAYLDRQCRPRGVAGFVFAEEARAIAQISPVDPMVAPAFDLADANTIAVSAVAFGPNDPGCCPSI